MPLMELYSKGLLPLLLNIRLGQERLTLTNVVAYYNAELITVVKSLIVQAHAWTD
jgi:hypothetical protein